MRTLRHIVAATVVVTSSLAAGAARADDTAAVPVAPAPVAPPAPPAAASAPASDAPRSAPSGGLCPAPDGAPAVASVDPQKRLDYLAKAFDEEVRVTHLWSWTLGTVFLVAGGTQAAVLPVYRHDRATSIDLTVGAIGFGIGTVSLFAIPLQITLPLEGARSHWNEPDRCAVLARAEQTLVSVEKEEANETGWVPHVANIAVNAASALVLGLGYGHTQQAIFSPMIGIALGEANAFSQPHNLRDVLAKYRSGDLDGPPPPASKVGVSVVPVVSAQLTGSTVIPIAPPQMSGAGVALTW